MVVVSEAAIHAALSDIVDPCSIATGAPISLVEMGMVKSIGIIDGRVRIELVLTSPICWQAANIIDKVEKDVGALPGVRSVECSIDAAAEWLPEHMAPQARARLRAVRPIG